MQDRAQRAEAHRLLLEARGEAPEPDDDATRSEVQRKFMRSVLREGLLPALRTDATVFRAFLRGFNLLVSPEALMQDTEVMAKVLEAYQSTRRARARAPARPRPRRAPRTLDRHVDTRRMPDACRRVGCPAAGAPSADAPAAGAWGAGADPGGQWSAVVARWARSLAAMCSGSVGFERYASAPERPAAHQVALVGLAGEHQDVGVGRQAALAARLEDVVAVDVRHHHVEDHRGGRVRRPAGRWPRARRRRSGR